MNALRRRTRNHRSDDGLMAIELAILAPVVIVMLLVVVAFGRVTHGRALVDQAAAAAARAASLTTTPGQAAADAAQTARDTLAAAGLSCAGAGVDVDTGAFRPGGQVTVAVTCTTDLSATALAGLPGSLTLHAEAVSPIETYRDVTGAAP
ncbi:MAG: pilus assembly protein [Kineosporiaceae bacterium]|nr:pilus assembly protein [Kineosporiaceae bacterium]